MICGIDPGLGGALVWLNWLGQIEQVRDMPVAPTGTNSRNEVAALRLATELKDLKPDLIVLEHVSVRPGEGSVGAFAFGQGFGVIIGVTAALEIPVSRVRPTIWKKAMKLKGKGKKGAAEARARAMEYWPAQHEEFKRVRDDGRAEAALLALGHIKGEY